jgi:hypothetical protein
MLESGEKGEDIMANGELCKHCGYQEADHDLKKARKENGKRCYRFESEFRHKRNCPVLDCDGDCEKRIREEKERQQSILDRMATDQPAIFFRHARCNKQKRRFKFEAPFPCVSRYEPGVQAQ